MSMSDDFAEKSADFPAPKALRAAPAAPLPQMAKRAGPSLRYLLPAVLFIFMVGAITWITQFMPNRRVTKSRSCTRTGCRPAPAAFGRRCRNRKSVV